MDDMAAHVRRCREHGLPSLMYVYGLEGLGVSCLVTQFWRDHRDLVEGQLIWLSGRSADGELVPVGELLTKALRQFGIAAADQGVTAAEKTESLHRVWRDKKFVLVVDDLANWAQVLSFIPFDAAGAITIATSPFRQRELEQRGFADFTPDLLPDDAARTLFVAGLKVTAEELEPAVIDELTDYCSGLPLLIKVLSAQIYGRAHMAQHLLGQLQSSGFRPSELDAEKRIPRFLDAAYVDLDAVDRQTYRWLGVLPAQHIGLDAATAVLGGDESGAVYLRLEKLSELSLLTRHDQGSPRYAFHSVVHDDARDRAVATDDAAVQIQALTDWITWYLRETLARTAAISDRWWVSPVTDLLTEFYGDRVPRYTRAQALEWLELEEANVIAAVRAAHRARLDHLVWPFCVALWKYLHLHGLHDAWIDIHLLGLASARNIGSELGVMQLTSQLGAVYLELREFDAARRHFTESHDIAQAHNHVLGKQSALEWLGKIAAAEGHFEVALVFYQQSWDVVAHATDEQISPSQRSRAFAILLLQRARAELGANNLDRARTAAEDAVAAFEPRATETDNSAKAHLVLGRAHLALGDAPTAIATFERALELFATERVAKQQAVTNHLIGDAHRVAGDPTTAITHYRRALNYYRRVGSTAATVVTDSIVELNG